MIIYENNRRAASEQIGIKACSLIHLQKIGMETPDWFALGADCFHDFIYDHREEYFSLLRRYSEVKRQKFIKSLERTEFTDETKAKIIAAIHKHFAPDDLLAIRTSITDADLDNPYIGVYQTYLYVKQNEKLFTYLKKCYISCFAEKAMTYRFKNNLLSREFGAAIIVQKMVDPDYSGIIFTTNPKTNNTNESLIIVTNGASHRNTLNDQNSAEIVVDKNAGIKTDLMRSRIAINDELVLKLQRIGQTIENSFEQRVAHDIEFVIKDEKIYIMQSRPMAEYLYVDKNKTHTALNASMLAHGLKGATTPLTQSFTHDLFTVVQKQLIQDLSLGEEDTNIANQTIDKTLYIYENSIYLRQNEYQKILNLRSAPKTQKGLKKLRRLNPKKYQSLTRLKAENEIFDQKFEDIIRSYIGNPFRGYTNIQLLETYHDFETELLDDFTTQISNCAKISDNYNKLLNLANTAKVFEAKTKLNNVLFGQNRYKNIAKETAFYSILKEIRRDPLLVDLFIRTETPELIEKLHTDALLIFSKINHYINEFGFYGEDELKLEATTLKDDPTPLIEEIKQHLTRTFIPEEKDQVHSSEEAFIDKFRNIQKNEVRSLLETTKYLVITRAKLHEKHVRLSNIIRLLYLKIGANFAAAGIIQDENDIFFLKNSEISAIIEKGKYTHDEIEERITKRKNEYAENLQKPYHDCMHFYGAIQPENMIVFNGED